MSNIGDGQSSGTLKTKLTIKPVVPPPTLTIPFHCMAADLPSTSGGGAFVNLLHAQNVMPDVDEVIPPDLNSFLTNLPGRTYDMTTTEARHASLRALIDRPPISKQLLPLTQQMLASFNLTTAKLPHNMYMYANSVVGDTDLSERLERHTNDEQGVEEKTLKVHSDYVHDADLDPEPKAKRRKEDESGKERKKKKKDKKEKKKRNKSPTRE